MRVYWVWSLATSMNLHEYITFCSFWELWGHFLFFIDWEVVKSYQTIVEELSHHWNQVDWLYNFRGLISLVDFSDFVLADVIGFSLVLPWNWMTNVHFWNHTMLPCRFNYLATTHGTIVGSAGLLVNTAYDSHLYKFLYWATRMLLRA